jgi:aminoglycoside phosphotransferase family enzyme/predicted kinase
MSTRTDQTDYASQQILVAALLDRKRFPHAAQGVRLVETHISWVLLAGRYAYKIKKALDLGFLNFTSLEARQFYCSEEIRLNRRLAPGIYLDVIPIGGGADAPEFGKQPAIEYAVRMRRFATAREFDHLLARGKVMPQHMDDLAAALAAFHGELPQAEADSVFGTPATIRAAAMQNFETLLPLLTTQAERDAVTKLRLATANAYTACEIIFRQRRVQGYVRECHGDLHLGNIVLIGKQPVPFDGIEFNPTLRWIDVMDEVAFLVMDLLHGSRPDLAFRFLNAYLEATGDYAGVSVLHFYLAYRAGVRAKVSAIRAFQAIPDGTTDKPIGHSTRPSKDDSQVAGYQPDSDQSVQTQALTACRNYLALASECLAQRRPALIITHGLPGSGKSTFAQVALERLQAIRIRSDVERKRLFDMSPLDDSHSRAGNDIYSPDATRRTYTRLHELARDLLDAGFPVIVDAAFLKQDEREQFQALALGMSAPFAIVSMQASPATLNARIMRRRSTANDASEADLGVLQMLQTAQQPLLPYEMVRTVEFLNDADHEGIPADAASWGRLDELLAVPED